MNQTELFSSTFGRVTRWIDKDTNYQKIVIQGYDLSDSIFSTDILPALCVARESLKRSASNNTAIFIIDLRLAKNFNIWDTSRLIGYIKSSRDIFSKKLSFSQVVVNTNSAWLGIFKYLFRLVKTARPVRITTFNDTPEYIKDILSAST